MKVLLGLLTAAQLMTAPLAMDVMNYAEPEIGVEEAGEKAEPTREEMFKWYYRLYNGVKQKRLWSLTYGYWVTDWIDCD